MDELSEKAHMERSVGQPAMCYRGASCGPRSWRGHLELAEVTPAVRPAEKELADTLRSAFGESMEGTLRPTLSPAGDGEAGK